jgi:hypothetical protein
MTENGGESGSTQDLIWLLSSFTDNGRSLRSFINHPQELGICVLTAGLLANSKLMISPEDAIKSSFDIYKRIQDHVARYQSMTFASNIENVFTERAPEVEGD